MNEKKFTRVRARFRHLPLEYQETEYIFSEIADFWVTIEYKKVLFDLDQELFDFYVYRLYKNETELVYVLEADKSRFIEEQTALYYQNHWRDLRQKYSYNETLGFYKPELEILIVWKNDAVYEYIREDVTVWLTPTEVRSWKRIPTYRKDQAFEEMLRIYELEENQDKHNIE
jgi:hypothetical protein